YARAEQTLHLDFAALVIADGADVFSAKAKRRAGDHGARNLPSWAQDFLMERDLAAVCRKVRHDQHGVGCVKADADDVKRFGQVTILGECAPFSRLVRYNQSNEVGLLAARLLPALIEVKNALTLRPNRYRHHV